MNLDLETLLAALADDGVQITITITRLQPEPAAPDLQVTTCEYCGAIFRHRTAESARRALRTHQARHCTSYPDAMDWNAVE